MSKVRFESRNPEAQAWLGWNEVPGERDTPAGRLQESLQTTPPDTNGVVVMHIENRFLADGHDAPLQQRLQFRSYEQIVADLQQAGLEVAACYRDWQRAPFTGGAEQPLMVFVAKKPLE
ncbi:MAG: hypothetical protein Q3999_01625 [Buchananella hordeovulneris]|nr:hypothetical protein [Buchananella hordeovulneris]